MPPPDNHVHTRWSWDTAASSSMRLACARAVEVGIPGLAFTEHVDFTDWSAHDSDELAGTAIAPPTRISPRPRVKPFDVEGYSADLARCREEFPELRILSGIEAGKPHLFPASVAAVLAAGNFERVLGSLHGIVDEGTLTGISHALFARVGAHELMRRYFADLVALVDGSSVFNVLAHCDYPRRYWPAVRVGAYAEADFEEEYRTVFRTLASSGRALEINTRSPTGVGGPDALVVAGGWRRGLVRQRRSSTVPGRRALRPGGRRRRGGRIPARARPVRFLAALTPDRTQRVLHVGVRFP